ncbi:hypothetical protein ACIRST_18345 [Kitasatospora sp. NPDC101447]|uniref:hypothetical protein n=1 Tax=Kitasatospora sp. NPDC101447 TaxID=3364102 RepID=UPI0037FB9CF9
MENGSPTPRRARNAAYLFIGLGLATTLVFGVVFGVRSLGRAWAGEPYPTADPAATATRVNDRLLAAYDAFGLSRAPELDPQVTPAVEADVYDCHRRGFAHALDGIDDSAPHEPRTAAIHAGFSVRGLTAAQAEAAVRSAERTLNDQGWTVTVSREPDRVRLVLEPPKPGGAVAPSGSAGSAADAVPASVSATVDYANGYLHLSAGAECARYPEDTRVDDEGKPEGLPALTLPAQLRRS